MSLKLGNTAINKLYLGATQINKLYLGSGVVFTTAIVSQTDPVFHYELDTTITDSAGSLDGTIVGSPSYVPTPNGFGLDYNGTTDGVTIPSNSVMALETFTLSFYVYIPTATESWSTIFEFNRGGLNWVGLFRKPSSTLFSFRHLNAYDFNANFTPDTWVHIVLTSDNSTAKTYLNGVLDRTISSVASLTSTSGIGSVSVNNDGNERIDIIQDDLRMYNRVLEQAEITELYDTLTAIDPLRYNIPFNGTTEDIVRLDFGTTTGTVSYTSGVYNQAIDIPELSYIDYSLDGSLDLNNFSVSAWIYINDYLTSWRTWLSYDNGGPSWWEWGLHTTTDQLITRIGAQWVAYGPALQLNTWYHIVATHSTNLRISYIDKVQELNSTVGTTISDSASDLRVGGNSAGNELSNIRIQNLQIYNKILSQVEVDALYDSQVGPTIVARVNGGGPAITSTDGYMDWEANNSSTPITGTNYTMASTSGGTLNQVSVAWTNDDSVNYLPTADLDTLYDLLRYGDTQWTFPLGNGTYTVRLFTGAPTGSDTTGSKIFDVLAESVVVGNDLDTFTLNGGVVTQSIMVDFKDIAVSDGTLNIDFVGIVGSPTVYGIEILKTSIDDADAIAFIDAVATLTTAEEDAIKALVTGLKANGTWDKYHAIYPFIGGTAAAHKWNLKNPLDTDAAFRLTYSGTLTHSSLGIKGDGVASYADTNFNPISEGISQTSASLHAYKQTASTGGSTVFIGNMGNRTNVGQAFLLGQFSGGTKDIGLISNSGTGEYTPNSGTVTTSGLVSISVNGSNSAQHYINGATNGSANAQLGVYGNINLYISAMSSFGAATEFYTDVDISFAAIADGFSATEIADDYTTIQAYQAALGRRINEDALAFIDAVGTLTTAEEDAIKALVIGLKANGTWDKHIAIYPMIGGTASAHKWNLKDPRDLDAAHRITWIGTVTHSSSGAKPDGITGLADTNLNLIDYALSTEVSISYYTGTLSTGNRTEMGVNLLSKRLLLEVYWGNNDAQFDAYWFDTSRVKTAVLNDTLGYYQGSRLNASLSNLYLNGSLLGQSVGTNTKGVPDGNVYIFGVNQTTNNNFSDRESRFNTIGFGLTEAEMVDDYATVQQYQIALGRQV